LEITRRFGDGSFLSAIYPSQKDRRHGTGGIKVRVIEYVMDGRSEPGDDETTYRLLTTILDPKRAPAHELAALYPERWEFETALDELKTHQRSPRVVLRSKMPDGVTQEVYGYLCVHYAVRWLMHSVAQAARGDPDRLSFTRTLRVARRTAVSHPGSPPEVLDDAERQVYAEPLFELLPKRRLRDNPRAAKRKMSNLIVKRPEHRCPPAPPEPRPRVLTA
jgi:hypothetical protein